jgi:hypothetical protein
VQNTYTIELPIGSCGNRRGLGLSRLELSPVILDEILLLSVTVAGVELVLVHFGHHLFEVPMIVSEAVYAPTTPVR